PRVLYPRALSASAQHRAPPTAALTERSVNRGRGPRIRTNIRSCSDGTRVATAEAGEPGIEPEFLAPKASVLPVRPLPKEVLATVARKGRRMLGHLMRRQG